MLKKTLASLVFATSLLSVAACKDPQIIAVPAALEAAKPGLMTVTGTATLEVSPDCADLTMTISVDGARPGIATAGVQAKQQELVAALMKLGIETADLKLSHLTLQPIYSPDADGGWSQLRVATYRAQITVTATTRRFDQIGTIMDAGAQAGATSMSSQFRRADLPELKKQVRDLALAAAKAKATQTAKALGIALGRVVSVAEAPAGHMWSSGYFPPVANEARPIGGGSGIGGVLQPLTLDITLGFELGSAT
jgi:hypothetical protein